MKTRVCMRVAMPELQFTTLRGKPLRWKRYFSGQGKRFLSKSDRRIYICMEKKLDCQVINKIPNSNSQQAVVNQRSHCTESWWNFKRAFRWLVHISPDIQLIQSSRFPCMRITCKRRRKLRRQRDGSYGNQMRNRIWDTPRLAPGLRCVYVRVCVCVHTCTVV